MSTLSKKPQIGYSDLSQIDEALIPSFSPSTSYSLPTYTFDVTPSASASATVSNEYTRFTCAIYGPHALPPSATYTEYGEIHCSTSFAPFAFHHLTNINRVQNSQQQQTIIQYEDEINTIIEQTFSSVVRLELLPKHAITIVIFFEKMSSNYLYDTMTTINIISLLLSTISIEVYDTVIATTLFYQPTNLYDLLTSSSQSSQSQSSQQQHNSTKTTPKTPTIQSLLQPYQTSCIELDEQQIICDISVTPTSSLMNNILTQLAVKQSLQIPPCVAMAYLPSLNQVVFSKLQGTLPDAKTQWSTLSKTAISFCIQIDTIQNQYLRQLLTTRLEQLSIDVMNEKRDFTIKINDGQQQIAENAENTTDDNSK